MARTYCILLFWDIPFIGLSPWLFGSFWLLFPPLIYFQYSRYRGRSAFFLGLIISVLHILLFATLVVVCSSIFMSHSFDFSKTFIDAVGENGIACLLIYGYTAHFSSINRKPKPQKQKRGQERLLISHKGRKILLNYEDIIYVSANRPYISIVTKTESIYPNLP